MKYKNIFVLAPLFALFLSCAAPDISIHELLMAQPSSKLHTAHNVWHDKQGDIFQLNCQRGRILPLGTEVEIIHAYRHEIAFRDVRTGKTYRIFYKNKTAILEPEDYLKQFFTVKTPEEIFSGIRPEVLDKVKAGIVEKGMTKNEVLAAYGYPSVHRTPSTDEDTWIYFDDLLKTKRVIFSRKGIVVDILR